MWPLGLRSIPIWYLRPELLEYYVLQAEVEFVKCFIRARFQIFQFCLRKGCKTRHFWECFNSTKSSKDEFSTRSKDNLGLQIFISLSEINHKIWMTPTPLPPNPALFDLSESLEVVWMSSESYSSSFRPLVFLSSCLSVFLSKKWDGMVIIGQWSS